MKSSYPFLFGAQYYRAPTPEAECWAGDLRRMNELGFNAVKLWAQWRWSHRRGDRFIWDDLDTLMDLAQANHLRVTINVVFDVTPHWLFEQYPDAKQVLNNGQVVEPYVVGHRQLGGHPGPCYNHPGCRDERRKFLRAAVERYRGHPALDMWDIWNEPELCFPQRTPKVETLACYCPNCRREFLAWLQVKYASLAALNQVWGRDYDEWREVELPRGSGGLMDFIDWREFHNDTLTAEAAWRTQLTRALDPAHTCYLHVVPNSGRYWNPISCCSDDFDLAEQCDVFAATMHGGPLVTPLVVSAGRGKVCYNVESHVNFGSTSLHQRMLNLPDLLADFIPQVGLGIKGFLFWQFRPEVLGHESPAWGVVNLDGSDRPVTRAVQEFWRTLAPHADRLMNSYPQAPQIGIWKSRRNEIFHFALHQSTDPLSDSFEGYLKALWAENLPYTIINSHMLERQEGLEGLKLLILPGCYALSEAEAAALDAWVRQGGALLAEAHLAGFNLTSGRHSRILPGCGLAEKWGLREIDSTSSYHLKLEQSEAFLAATTEDARKALAGSGTTGALYYPIRLSSGTIAWGAERYAVLSGAQMQPEGYFEPGAACLASVEIGQGRVFYSGTNLGRGAGKDRRGLLEILRRLAQQAGIAPTLNVRNLGDAEVHLNLLEEDGQPRFLVIHNPADVEQQILLPGLRATLRGLFSKDIAHLALDGKTPISIPARFVDLFIVEAPPGQ